MENCLHLFCDVTELSTMLNIILILKTNRMRKHKTINIINVMHYKQHRTCAKRLIVLVCKRGKQLAMKLCIFVVKNTMKCYNKQHKQNFCITYSNA